MTKLVVVILGVIFGVFSIEQYCNPEELSSQEKLKKPEYCGEPAKPGVFCQNVAMNKIEPVMPLDHFCGEKNAVSENENDYQEEQ